VPALPNQPRHQYGLQLARLLLAADTTLAEQAVAGQPDLIIYAAGYRRPEAVRLLAAVGFD
jgi:hypothetical protein